MKRYIAYFDFLGYKQFILNNESDHIKKRVSHLLRDIESALSDKLKQSAHPGTVVADLQSATIHCLNISDTVIFYTDDDSESAFRDLLRAASKFNWRCNRYNFPVRGVVVLDEFEIIAGNYVNDSGITYSPNIVYGKGLVLSHLKCELQNWAGCCIDSSVIGSFEEEESQALFSELAIEYPIPLKNDSLGVFSTHAVRLYVGGANETAIENISKAIVQVFSNDGKGTQNESVQEKIKNTLDFVNFLHDK